MSDFNYTSFPIPAKPLSGVGETSYLSALLGIAPGGVKKVPTDQFLAAAGVYPVALLQCTPQITQVVGDVAANTTLIPLIADTSVSGGTTGVSTGGLSVGDSSPNTGKIIVSEAGIYRISCSLRVTRTSSDGGECGAVIMKNGSTVITSVYSEADTDDHFTLTCPTVIASLASGDVLSLNAAIVGGSSDTMYINGASLLPEGVPTPTSVVLVERLNSASGDSSSSPSLAEVAAEVEDIRTAYDGTVYSSAGASVRAQIEEAMNHSAGDSVTVAIKQALLQLASKVAYIDNQGADYYDALYWALYPPIPATGISISDSNLSFGALNSSQTLTATLYPSDTTDTVSWSSSDTSVATVTNVGRVTSVGWGSCTITASAGEVYDTCSVTVAQATVVSISAVYTQSGTVYNTTSLDSLKEDLVVTATWSDSNVTTVDPEDYTLSGTLTVGTSTVTVSYGGQTTTFTVTVTEAPLYPIPNSTSTGVLISNGNEFNLTSSNGMATYFALYKHSRGSINVINNANTQFTIPAGAEVKMKVTVTNYTSNSSKNWQYGLVAPSSTTKIFNKDSGTHASTGSSEYTVHSLPGRRPRGLRH